MVLVTRKDKPFLYSAKGTPLRKAIITDYKTEIEELYQTVEDTSVKGLDSRPPTWSLEESTAYVRTVVHNVMTTTLGDDDDLFEHGCDSLQANRIRKTIIDDLQSRTKANTRGISPAFVYDNPSINTLGKSVADLVSRGATAQSSNRPQMNSLPHSTSFKSRI
jgi:hypothetical protein